MKRWLAVLFVLVLLAISSPSSAPFGVQYADAASYPYTRYATWKFDDSSDTSSGSGFYRVQMAVSWQTSDPSGVCYQPYSTGVRGSSQHAYLGSIPQCVHSAYGPNPTHFYPSRILSVSCWVASSVVYAVLIDQCGQLLDPQNYPPYWWTVGARIRVCLGIVISGTPLGVCYGFKSALYIEGSSVYVHQSPS